MQGSAARVIMLMGVAGSGKSTIGGLLSERLGWPFRDADSFHPRANVEKMKSGTPLTDEDRRPWLEAIAAYMDERLGQGQSAIVSCSALRRAYREVLTRGRPGVMLVHLAGSKELIGSRLSARRGHFMPPALLDSQFATLEAPAPEEGVLTMAVDEPPERIAERIVAALA